MIISTSSQRCCRRSSFAVATSATLTLALLALTTLIQPVASFAAHHQPTTALLGPRIPIDETFPNLERIHTSPDIYVIQNFLDDDACQDMMERASSSGDMAQSPVAYAGWTEDFKDLLELAVKGPVSWLAIGIAWFQTKDTVEGEVGASQIDLVGHMLQNFAALLVMAVVGIAAFTKSRADGLQQLRTSTSTTIPNLDGGSGTFVRRAAALFGDGKERPDAAAREASLFEAPTVIRYEAGQILAPHYDANRSAQTEDANRGGQTLATLLVYLNDVQRGGLTRFGKLNAVPTVGDAADPKLTIQPKKGDALLFFPADARGTFDETTEHEGCAAVDEKWIARIWRHSDRVPPPFGLADEELKRL